MGKSVCTGFQVWSALEADPDLLDPPIRPLVTALNQTTWARTIFSCAGHPEEPDSIQTGRRQAHIDLLISDLPRWHHFVATLKRSTKRVRITEAPLGPIPPWLASHLPPPAVAGAAPAGPAKPAIQLGVQGNNRAPAQRERRALGGGGQGAASPGRQSLTWHY